MVTWENYEEYMILHIDGELNEAEQKALMDFIQLHPELREELDMYRSACLKPDPEQIFPYKEALLKPAGGGRTMVFRQWWMYGAAAGLLLLILINAAGWFRDRSHNSDMAHPIVQQDSRTETLQPLNRNEPQQPPVISNASASGQSRGAQGKENISIAGRNNVHSNKKNPVKEVLSFPKAELSKLQPVVTSIPEHKQENPAAPAKVDIPVWIADADRSREPKDSDLLVWMPEEKKDGLLNLKETLDHKIEKARTLKDNLKDTQVALRFGNRELLVINF